MKRVCILIQLLVLTAASAITQKGPGMVPGENVAGKVTAIAKGSITVSPLAGGDPVTLKVSDGTRIMKDRQQAGVSDIKVGDTVFARGPLTGQTMEAGFVAVVDPSMVQQRMQQGPMSQFKPEDMGKKFIAGEVKAINETRLTIARPDNQTQEIEVDENTSFKKGKESVTLADITVGEFVRGAGEIKNGVFVPKELIVGRPRMQMMIGGPGGKPGDQKPPETQKPATDPPK
jgi:hypothetical protein